MQLNLGQFRKQPAGVLFGILGAIILFGFAASSWSADLAMGDCMTVRLPSKGVPNGGVFVTEIDLRLVSPFASGFKLSFMGRDYPVRPHPSKPPNILYSLVGVPYLTKIGPAKLYLHWRDENGSQTEVLPIKVMQGRYKSEKLRVNPAKVILNRSDQKRAVKESIALKRVYANSTPWRMWRETFQRPMQSKITSKFGNKRMYNRQLKRFHNGVDFRARPGTPLYAANSGKVILAKNLFFSGNTVILDHGLGLFTLYAHLSRLDVKFDQMVSKGQHLGLSGATGRVNGPHLHWGVKLHGLSVNPLQLIEAVEKLYEFPSQVATVPPH